MTNDGQSRSSTAGPGPSFHSPRENGDEASNEPQRLRDTTPSAPQSEAPAPAPSLSKPSDTSLPASITGESQPMTASNSASSILSAKENITGGATSAIPYGTRSRNRTGTSRPNYAEDKEMDAEIEGISSASGRKVTRGNDAGIVAEGAGSSTAPRNNPGLDSDHGIPTQNHHKEPIPGTSTFSASPGTAAGSNGTANKKRKATTQTGAVQNQSQASTSTPAASQPVTRRSSIATQVIPGFRETNMLSFDNCGGRLKSNKLVADDGTTLEVNDHVYLICEPPGEPYYLGRIMEFLHTSNDTKQPIDALRLNWYYRPKDIGRKVNDTRQVFASMHSDISPLTSLRGKCQIKHKSEVDRLDDLRKTSDSFWYEKLYDRYIHRFYDVVPTSQVINVPVEVKKVLDERWKYIIVEPSRGKELTSAVKSCKRCNKYCASNDSVDCAVCQNTYHMSCVSPPLLKKPSRGFAWACGPCSKAQEKRLEARNTPNIMDPVNGGEDEDFNDEEGDSPGHAGDVTDTGQTSPTTASEPGTSFHPGTAEQIHQASLWLFRYLGIHCKVEDALDYDDRIYPRASSRLGPKHQAIVPPWPGRPVKYVKPAEIKKKYLKGGNHKKDAKLSRETLAALEADKIAREQRPKWVVDEPPGYVHRGEDLEVTDPRCTSQLLYKLPGPTEIPGRITGSHDAKPLSEPAREQIVFDYMGRAAAMAKPLVLPPLSTNLLDVALEILQSNGYDVEMSLDALARVDRKIFKEPELTPPELKKFEDGVTKYGSEWHSIKKHVKTVSPADIVRFYYTWKKTERGKQIWGNYSGRKGKKEAKKAEATIGKLQDDVADEYDDSAFDNDKAFEKKRGFQCKFCFTKSSRQWRRAPHTAAGTMVPENPGGKSSGKDKGAQLMVALCRRCAELWRRYAIQWEDIDEVQKKVAQAGGRSWKRKIDEELLKELVAANEVMNQPEDGFAIAPLPLSNAATPLPGNPALGSEPPRKRARLPSDRDSTDPIAEGGNATVQRKKAAPEKPVVPPPPPPPPEPPKAKILPCAICGEMDPMGDQHLSCKDCRMTVHRNCYGVVGENRSPSKWVCDMCSNDKNPQVSIQYQCMLCPVEFTEHDFVEPPKMSHKRKTEKDRERDRLEREHAQSVADYFQKKQEELNKPANPREPLKRTANNNWVHVTCAVFHPEVKFGNARALEPSEGIPSIPSSRYEETCKVCKKGDKGACVNCHSCRTAVHVECAHQAGYVLGFDITPVKGSRRDQFNIVNIASEVGTMTAAIWCKDHVPTKTIVHRMHDIVNETGLNALQLYVQNFKQADLTLTGTVRKATLVNQSTKIANPPAVVATPNRRTSTTITSNGTTIPLRGLLSQVKPDDGFGSAAVNIGSEKVCATCNVDISPRWWPFPDVRVQRIEAPVVESIELNGVYDSTLEASAPNGNINSEWLPKENGETYGALAAAALHQNGAPSPVAIPTEFQCHQCHWNKKSRKEPTPPPPPEPPQEREREREREREPPRPLVGLSPSAISVPTPDREIVQPVPSPYTWPPATPYPQNGLSNGSSHGWSRRSPVPQSVGLVNHVNGHRSPHIHAGVVQMSHHPQSHVRGPSQGAHQGNRIPPPPPSNSYPPSPHRGMAPSGINHSQTNSYTPYGSSRPPPPPPPPPPPHHLTNGGPPPRAPELPFLQGNSSMHHRPPFGSHQGSPPILRDAQGHNRESSQGQINGVRPNDVRPNDGRVNGGASASPSLRNLLS